MKRFLIEALLALALVAPAPAPAMAVDAPPEAEREYLDAIVALIDHSRGLVAASVRDEVTGKEQKFSFKADLENLTVLSASGQLLEFEQVQIGDRIDIATEVRGGKEKIVDIVDFDRFPE